MYFNECFLKGTYCHTAHAVLSDNVKVGKSNRNSPYTAGSAPTLHYSSHKSVCRSYLNILCTVFFDIPSSDDKLRSVSRLSVVNQVFDIDQIFATTFDLMVDIPRPSSSSVTKVFLGIASATFKTLMIVCILSDIILKPLYASVYEFYPAIRKTVSLQCISHRRLTSCLISRSSSLLMFLPYLRPGKSFKANNHRICCHMVMITAQEITQSCGERN